MSARNVSNRGRKWSTRTVSSRGRKCRPGMSATEAGNVGQECQQQRQEMSARNVSNRGRKCRPGMSAEDTIMVEADKGMSTPGTRNVSRGHQECQQRTPGMSAEDTRMVEAD